MFKMLSPGREKISLSLTAGVFLFLCLFPWAPLFIKGVDLWHGQGHAAQVGILLFFCFSFVLSRKSIVIRIWPVAVLVLWVGLQTLSVSLASLRAGQYALVPLVSFFNFLCIVIFYKLCLDYLTAAGVTKIIKYLPYALVGLLGFCLLQKLGVAQFTQQIESVVHHPQHDKFLVTGYLGHPTHLAGYLGMCLPLFFGRRVFNIICVAVVSGILLLFTGMSYTVSLSGIITGAVVSLYYVFFTSRKLFLLVLVIFVVAGAVTYHTSGAQARQRLLCPEGKLTLWYNYLVLSKPKFITGRGLGTVNALALADGRRDRHVHNEFLHAHVELGLLGLLAILYLVVDFFRVPLPAHKYVITLRACFLGFLITCLFNWPGHLWAVTVMAAFFYAGIQIIRNELVLTGGVF
jgi:O-antigen ligase